ncbi:unnamed protein product [Pylaiella littoralis]
MIRMIMYTKYQYIDSYALTTFSYRDLFPASSTTYWNLSYCFDLWFILNTQDAERARVTNAFSLSKRRERVNIRLVACCIWNPRTMLQLRSSLRTFSCKFPMEIDMFVSKQRDGIAEPDFAKKIKGKYRRRKRVGKTNAP